MRLDDAAIRAKVIELYDRCDLTGMNLWLASGIVSGVLDPDLAERAMIEELPRRSHDVQRYWLGACDCHTANLS